MTRRVVTLAAFVATAGAVVVLNGCGGGDDGRARNAGPPTGPSVPPLSAPAAGSSGAEGRDSPSGAEDGDLGGRTVSVDSTEPAVSRLNPELLAAVRDAASAAADDGVEVRITSGWRSREYQQRLLEEAITTYGSREEALRWVATPDTSAHIPGAAVDVGPTDAAYWMSEHGAEFGLCQTFANEIWHYEILTTPGGTCPTPRVDGTS